MYYAYISIQSSGYFMGYAPSFTTIYKDTSRVAVESRPKTALQVWKYQIHLILVTTKKATAGEAWTKIANIYKKISTKQNVD
jgi:hypothetical protein